MPDSNKPRLQADLSRAFQHAAQARTQLEQTLSTWRVSTRMIDDTRNRLSDQPARDAKMVAMYNKSERLKNRFHALGVSVDEDVQLNENCVHNTTNLGMAHAIVAAGKFAEFLVSAAKVVSLLKHCEKLVWYKQAGAKYKCYDNLKNALGAAENLNQRNAAGVAGAVGKIAKIGEFERIAAMIDVILKGKSVKDALGGGSSPGEAYKSVVAMFGLLKSLAEVFGALLKSDHAKAAGEIIAPIKDLLDMVNSAIKAHELFEKAKELAVQWGETRFHAYQLRAGLKEETWRSIQAYTAVLLEETKTKRGQERALTKFGYEIRNEAQAKAWMNRLRIEIQEARREVESLKPYLDKRVAARRHAGHRLEQNLDAYARAVNEVYRRLDAVKTVDGQSSLDEESAKRHLDKLGEFAGKAVPWLAWSSTGFNPRVRHALGVNAGRWGR